MSTMQHQLIEEISSNSLLANANKLTSSIFVERNTYMIVRQTKKVCV